MSVSQLSGVVGWMATERVESGTGTLGRVFF